MLAFLGAISALLSVALGAFGAHGLKDHVTPERLATFDVGVHYQLAHSLALLLLAALEPRWPGRAVRLAGGFLSAGIVLFSGSLYALVLLDAPRLGMITPVGGLAFLAGWAVMAWTAWRARRS